MHTSCFSVCSSKSIRRRGVAAARMRGRPAPPMNHVLFIAPPTEIVLCILFTIITVSQCYSAPFNCAREHACVRAPYHDTSRRRPLPPPITTNSVTPSRLKLVSDMSSPHSRRTSTKQRVTKTHGIFVCDHDLPIESIRPCDGE